LLRNPQLPSKSQESVQNSEEYTEIVELPVEEGVLRPLLGPGDSNLHYLQRFVGSRITARREKILLRGAPGENLRAVEIVMELVNQTRRRGTLSPSDIDSVIRLAGVPAHATPEHPEGSQVIIRSGERAYGPRTPGQAQYHKAILNNHITFGIGPAGTGKTFIAVAVAVAQFLAGKYDRIILCRPVVEAGESLGFLPGDVQEKVDPYFRPLYDALMKMIPADRLRKFFDRSAIEIAPLAYMRGRTLDHAFVILDEAQNTNALQMKMFLTRLGEYSRAVITGDLTQIDLPRKSESGLLSIHGILGGIDGIEFCYFDQNDVVRHPLVAKIILAYEQYTKQQTETESGSADNGGAQPLATPAEPPHA
jgi:phosphate starvation-inducible protein PhoH and related proteins